MASSPATIQPYTDLSRFGALRAQAQRNAGGAAPAVARELEALFIQLMLKAARDATPDGGLFNSNELQFYRELFDNQVALAIAEQGTLGFEDLLRAQLPDADPAGGETALGLPERRAFPEHSAWYAPAAVRHVAGDAVDPAAWAAVDPGSAPRAPERQFAQDLRAHAERAAARLGTTPEILIAQAALETGWGQHVIRHSDGSSSNNLFSIKADGSWDGAIVKRRTLEFFGGKPVHVSAAFRSYDGIAGAFDDYVRFIESNPRYERALARAADPDAYINEIARAGYATDPRYAGKVREIHARIAASPDGG